MSDLIILVLGLVAGGLIIYLYLKQRMQRSAPVVSSQTVLEKVERVFKIILVEGYFAEIYDYKQTQRFLELIPITKKALLIVNAKVMVGYDFKKVRLEIDEASNEIRIAEFPAPEILSIDPEVKYYNVEDNILNKFSTEDLTRIQQEAKSIILERALQSDLPHIAQNQVRTLLLELGELRNWKLTGVDKLLVPFEPKKLIG
jgi:threonyl-tRNA synthetase